MISIIMPAYNAEKFIAASINSVLEQTYKEWELIIINDGSTDNTRAVAEDFTKNEPRIKVINQENKKLAGARNTGITNAKGTWIAFLDSDDLWTPDKLYKQISVSNEFPTVDVIYTDGWIFKDDNKENLTPYKTITGRLIGAGEMYKLEYQYNLIPVLSVMAKRSTIEKIGLQEQIKMFYGCEDWDYWLRMAKVGAEFYGIPEKLFYYRKHGNNMSDNVANMLLAQTSVFIKNYEKDFFTKKEAAGIFNGLIFITIKYLLKEERFEDSYFILNGADKILPSGSYKFAKTLIKLLGKKALIPVKIIGKWEKLFA